MTSNNEFIPQIQQRSDSSNNKLKITFIKPNKKEFILLTFNVQIPYIQSEILTE